MACRDLAKASRAAESLELPAEQYTLSHLDLGVQASVRAFVADFLASGRELNALVNNAAVYKPRLTEPARSIEGYEMSVATNHLGHFLLSRLLMDTLQQAKSARLITLGTVTANAEVGDYSGEVEATVEGDGTTIAFNARYLNDVLSYVNADRFALELNGPLSPGVFRPIGDDAYVHVVMPVRTSS